MKPTEKHTPRFGGLFLPSRLLNAEGLNILDKALLATVEALSRRGVPCYATNAHLAAILGVKEASIAQSLIKLDGDDLLAITVTPEAASPRSSAQRALAEAHRVKYAATRAIRLTARGCRFWLPDIEGGDDGGNECGSQLPNGTSETEHAEAPASAPSPSPSGSPGSSARPSTTANGSTGTHGEDKSSSSQPHSSGRCSSATTTPGGPSAHSGSASKVRNSPCDDGVYDHSSDIRNAHAGAHTRADYPEGIPYSRVFTELEGHASYAEATIEDPAGRVDDGPAAVQEIDICETAAAEASANASQIGVPESEDCVTESRAREDEELRAVLMAMGLPPGQAREAIDYARQYGRDHLWFRGWIAYANDHAANPAGYAYRQILANKELPHTISTAAAISSQEKLVTELRAKGIDDPEAQITRYGGKRVSDVLTAATNARKGKGWIVAALVNKWDVSNRLTPPDEPKGDPSGGDPYAREISPERRAQIDLKYEAAYRRTQEEDEARKNARRPTPEEEEAAGLAALKERLRQPLATEQPAPRLTALTDADRQMMAVAKSELDERRQRFGGEA